MKHEARDVIGFLALGVVLFLLYAVYSAVSDVTGAVSELGSDLGSELTPLLEIFGGAIG
jgi:hypothetical protein